jgi:hypothetical protein
VLKIALFTREDVFIFAELDSMLMYLFLGDIYKEDIKYVLEVNKDVDAICLDTQRFKEVLGKSFEINTFNLMHYKTLKTHMLQTILKEEEEEEILIMPFLKDKTVHDVRAAYLN